MSIEWPPLGDGPCFNFTLLATFGGYSPQAVRLDAKPAATAATSNPHTAAGPEPETFVTVQPLFHQDNQLALLLRLTRRSYYDGNAPVDPRPLAEVLRRADSFLGQPCVAQMVAEYFLPEWDAPGPVSAAVGPFGDPPGFRAVSGVIAVSDPPVKQIAWAFRAEPKIWAVHLTGGQELVMTADTARTAMAEFDAVFEAFRHAEPRRE